jgi:hypothetical protein
LEWGKPLFIELRRCCGACSGCPWRWLSGLRRGKAMTGDGAASSGGPCARHGAAGGGQERAGDVKVSAVPPRRSSTMASATGHGRERERVWELPGLVASEWVKGEGEGRSDASGRGRVLARPERVHARSGAFWAPRARPGQGNGVLSLARACTSRVRVM